MESVLLLVLILVGVSSETGPWINIWYGSEGRFGNGANRGKPDEDRKSIDEHCFHDIGHIMGGAIPFNSVKYHCASKGVVTFYSQSGCAGIEYSSAHAVYATEPDFELVFGFNATAIPVDCLWCCGNGSCDTAKRPSTLEEILSSKLIG